MMMMLSSNILLSIMRWSDLTLDLTDDDIQTHRCLRDRNTGSYKKQQFSNVNMQCAHNVANYTVHTLVHSEQYAQWCNVSDAICTTLQLMLGPHEFTIFNLQCILNIVNIVCVCVSL